MSTDERQVLTYIAEVSTSIAQRIEYDAVERYEPEVRSLAQDVAWLARQLSRLAAMKGDG